MMLNDLSKTGPNLAGGDVIKDCVYNILNTTKHARFFNRGLYSNLEELLFQNPTFVGSRLIKSSIVSIIKRELGSLVGSIIVEVDPNSVERVYSIRIEIEHNGEITTFIDRLKAGQA